MLLNRRCFLIPPVLLMKVNYDEVTPLKLARNRKKGSNDTIHSAIIAVMVSGSVLIYLCNSWHSLSSYRMNLLILFSMACSLGTETVGSITRFARRCKKIAMPRRPQKHFTKRPISMLASRWESSVAGDDFDLCFRSFLGHAEMLERILGDIESPITALNMSRRLFIYYIILCCTAGWSAGTDRSSAEKQRRPWVPKKSDYYWLWQLGETSGNGLVASGPRRRPWTRRPSVFEWIRVHPCLKKLVLFVYFRMETRL